jgi:hypothetical protein
MPVGSRIEMRLSRNADATFKSLDSVTITPFSHAVGFTSTYTVVKDDIANTTADVYIVTTNWASGDVNTPRFGADAEMPASSPPASSGVNAVSDAVDKVNAVFPGTFI